VVLIGWPPRGAESISGCSTIEIKATPGEQRILQYLCSQPYRTDRLLYKVRTLPSSLKIEVARTVAVSNGEVAPDSPRIVPKIRIFPVDVSMEIS